MPGSSVLLELSSTLVCNLYSRTDTTSNPGVSLKRTEMEPAIGGDVCKGRGYVTELSATCLHVAEFTYLFHVPGAVFTWALMFLGIRVIVKAKSQQEQAATILS